MVPGLKIAYVRNGSIAAKLGLEAEDIITFVNDRPLRDLIDFTFACAEDRLSLTVIKKDTSRHDYVVEKELDDDLGIAFSQATADGIRRCHNKCCFCFVDQMPPGLRSSLYVKDDDWRLSVLQGNFVTLTNLESEDIKRLTAEHLSPLYISVHTLNGQLRKQMMRSPRAAAIGDQLATLAKAGLELHCQIVLCPGLNDGSELKQTVAELARLYPEVASVAAVPVGLTRFRDQLAPLVPFSQDDAVVLLDWAQEQQKGFRERLGCTFFHVSDEFYVLTGQEVPPAKYYDGFPQLENGVGLIRQFLDDLALLSPLKPAEKENRIMLMTGMAAAKTVQRLADWCDRVPGFRAQVNVVTNNFWGPSVTAAGLLTAKDVLSGLQTAPPADHVFLPAAMFSAEGLTLDDWTLAEMEHAAGTELKIASSPEDVRCELVERSTDHD